MADKAKRQKSPWALHRFDTGLLIVFVDDLAQGARGPVRTIRRGGCGAGIKGSVALSSHAREKNLG
jgi:hypothetical protein